MNNKETIIIEQIEDYDDEETTSLLQRKIAVPKSYDETKYGIQNSNKRDKRNTFKGELPNSHLRAVNSCSCCPGFCFTTICGIHLHPLNVSLLILYLSGVFLFLWAVNDALGQRWTMLTSLHPSTSTSLQVHDTRTLDFPAITICNLAPHVPLTLLSCNSFDHQTDCPEHHVPKLVKKNKQKKNHHRHNLDKSEQQQQIETRSLDHCIAFNNKIGNSYTTQKRGLADALVVVLKINVDKYNKKNARFTGVHINLHPQCIRANGECPAELSSSLLAAPGIPRFYRMSKHVHEFLNGTISEYYDAKESSSGDNNFHESFGDRKDTVVLTFYYASMSMTVVKELPHYTWFSMFGEIGGIMGLLFGVGIINVLGGLLKSFVLGKEYLNTCFI